MTSTATISPSVESTLVQPGARLAGQPMLAPPFPNLVAMLRDRAEAHPDRLALVDCEAPSASQMLSYRELFNSSRRFARYLRQLGLGPGDRFLLLMASGYSFVETFFGGLMLGAIPVPVAPPFSARSLDGLDHALSILEDADATLLITTSRLAAALPEALAERGYGEVAVAAPPESPPEPLDVAEIRLPAEREIAFLQYTSGSTSHPKGVQLSHRNLVFNTRAIALDLGLEPGDMWISWLPLYHDMGLIGSILSPLMAGAGTVILSPRTFIKNPLTWLKAFTEYRGSVTAAPNFAYALCVRSAKPSDMKKLDLSSVRHMCNGAEPVHRRTVEAFQSTFAPAGLKPGVVLPVYGLAESSVGVSTSREGLHGDRISAEHLELEAVAVPAAEDERALEVVSVGQPLPSQEIAIVDDDGTPLPERALGEILIRGASVMEGYYRNPDASARALRDGWLYTGDLGYIAEGRLYVSGRKKDLVIIRGRNFFPQDIETETSKVEGIRSFRAIAFSEKGEETEDLVILAETRLTDPSQARHLAGEVARQVQRSLMIRPAVVALVEAKALPLTTSGKIRRRLGRSLYRAGRLPVIYEMTDFETCSS